MIDGVLAIGVAIGLLLLLEFTIAAYLDERERRR